MRFNSHSKFVGKGTSDHGWHILLNFMAGDAAEVVLAGRCPEARAPQSEADSTNQNNNTGACPQR
jgi:hypothetical protein